MTEDKQWEYRVETLGSALWGGVKPDKLTIALNQWGQEGWEVVNIHQPNNNNRVWVTMKRLLSQTERRQRARQLRGW